MSNEIDKNLCEINEVGVCAECGEPATYIDPGYDTDDDWGGELATYWCTRHGQNRVGTKPYKKD